MTFNFFVIIIIVIIIIIRRIIMYFKIQICKNVPRETLFHVEHFLFNKVVI